MLFKDFAQKLGFGDDIANVARGNNSELPRVGNVARKIDIALRNAVNDLFMTRTARRNSWTPVS